MHRMGLSALLTQRKMPAKWTTATERAEAASIRALIACTITITPTATHAHTHTHTHTHTETPTRARAHTSHCCQSHARSLGRMRIDELRPKPTPLPFYITSLNAPIRGRTWGPGYEEAANENAFRSQRLRRVNPSVVHVQPPPR